MTAKLRNDEEMNTRGTTVGYTGADFVAAQLPAPRCPECGGTTLEKYGRTDKGLQKYRCRSLTRKTADGKPFECRRQFVWGSTHRRIDEKVKRTVLSLLGDGVAPRTIAASIEGISLRRVYDLQKGRCK